MSGKTDKLFITDLVIGHHVCPVGIDCKSPGFGWKLFSYGNEPVQTGYQIQIYEEDRLLADTGKTDGSKSWEVTVEGWEAAPMTEYEAKISVWDDRGRQNSVKASFETGRLGTPFRRGWAEPVHKTAQYVRIPFKLEKEVKKGRVYISVNGGYHLEVNGKKADNREYIWQGLPCREIARYQTYDITSMLQSGGNVLGIILADHRGSGCETGKGCCQDNGRARYILECVIEYKDGTREVLSGDRGRSADAPFVFSDVDKGEVYNAVKDMPGWSRSGFDDRAWIPVEKAGGPCDNLVGQYSAPLQTLRCIRPQRAVFTREGDMILDMGRILQGQAAFSLEAEAGLSITMEYVKVPGDIGSSGVSGCSIKKQKDVYITKDGYQSYRPYFACHCFRYIRITGLPAGAAPDNFVIYELASEEQEDELPEASGYI